jgi:hypothetical protein
VIWVGVVLIPKGVLFTQWQQVIALQLVTLPYFMYSVSPQTALTATMDVRNPAVVDALPCIVVEAPIRYIGRERVSGSPITAPFSGAIFLVIRPRHGSASNDQQDWPDGIFAWQNRS